MKNNTSLKNIPTPTLEEILSDNFDYETYLKNYLDKPSDTTSEHSNNISKPNQTDPRIQKLLDEFKRHITHIQCQYEADLKTGQTHNYTQKMKQIAQKYYKQIQSIIKLKLQKENEFKALTAKRQELISVLKQVANIKAQIESQAESRLNAFVDKQIPIGKLYIYDLTHMRSTEVYRQNQTKLENYRRLVFANLQNAENAYCKPIEQLNIKGKQK